MPTLFKKIILSFLTFVILFVSIAPYLSIKAQTPTPTTSPAAVWYNPGAPEFFMKVFDRSNNDIFGERYTYAQVTWIAWSLIGVLAGFAGNDIDVPALIQEIQAGGPQAVNKILNESSMLANSKDPFNSVVSQFYLSPPASGKYWLAQKVNNFSIVKHAYAQSSNGFGYSSLGMFQPLWKASRNIAYVLMILIIISIAFAIMFRVKINPQTLVSIQSSLPKVASTLVLVTFSYAIAGFLIDLMYLIFGVVVYGLEQAGGFSNISNILPTDLFKDFVNGNIVSKVFESAGTGGSITIIVIIIALIALSFLVVTIPFTLGLLIAIFMFFIKTFIMLAQTYISLVINIVFAPLILLAEAIPFVKASAVGWFRSIIADILVFLAVGLLFVVQSVLNGIFQNASSGWAPPYLGYSSFWMRIIIWVGIWSILPNIRTMVYQMMEKRSADVQVPREFQGHEQKLQQAWQQFGESKGWKGFGGKGGTVKVMPN